MSLSSQVNDLAARLATEFNSVRDELSNAGASVTISETAPTGNEKTWFNSTNGTFYVKYDSTWVAVSGPAGPAGPAGPTGPAGATGPSGVGTSGAGYSVHLNFTTAVGVGSGTFPVDNPTSASLIAYRTGDRVRGYNAGDASKYFEGTVNSVQTSPVGININVDTIVGTSSTNSYGYNLSIVGVKGNTGPGVPIGGTAGQYLTKVNDAGYNTQWSTLDLSGYATKTGTETLTGKTLTSPKLNEDVALTATSTELNFVDGVTSSIQSQLDGKVSTTGTNTIELTTTTDADPLTIKSKNGHGGPGFAGLITVENTTSGATNTKKHVRMNNTGGIEIINSAYAANIFTLEDNGNLSGINNISANGTVSGTNLGDSGWQVVSSFANSYSGANVAYRKINGVVYLRGRVNGGTAGAGAFTLPSGYRPSTVEWVIPVQQYGTANINYVTIGTDGVVVPNGNAAWLGSVVFPVG